MGKTTKPRFLTIAVGYAWDPNDESRWELVRNFLNGIQEEVRRRYAGYLKRTYFMDIDGGEDFAEKAPSGAKKEEDPLACYPEYFYVSKVTRLRATAGRNIWEAIRQRIQEADLLVFDLTPPGMKDKCPTCIPGNVLLELGAALAQENHPPVYPIIDKYSPREKHIPSDLQGLMIGELGEKANRKTGATASLRMAIVNDLLRILKNC